MEKKDFEERFEDWLWERDLMTAYFDIDGVGEDTGIWLMDFLRGIFRDESSYGIKHGYKLSQEKLFEKINKWLRS